MKRTGADMVRRALEDEGIAFTFGIPGTHNIELYDALATAESVRPVLVTDEQSASFMADGFWRASGRMACVNLVPGAGLTHALSGIAEAYLDQIPMLVLGCGIRRDTEMAFQLHDVDQQSIVAPVTKATYLPLRGKDIYATIRDACRVARESPPGPVFVEIPADLYLHRHEVDGNSADGAGRVAPGVRRPPPSPPAGVDAGSVAAATALLTSAQRVLLYVGAGAARAAGEVLEVAERLEAPVSSTFQGKGVFPESHPLFLWPGFGTAAPPFVREIARECDVTLAVGCRFGEVGTGTYGLEPPGHLIHVDIDPAAVGRNFPARVGAVADARAWLGALLAALPQGRRGPDEALRDRIRAGHAGVLAGWNGHQGGSRVSPFRLLRALQRQLGPEAVYTADSGNGLFLAMEGLRLDSPGRFLAPVDYSCMGYAIPAALGASLARPGTAVAALVGDGAFLMTGLELVTAVREGLGVMALVLRDGELAQISQFQDAALGRKVGSTLPDFQVGELARGLGVDYVALDRDERVEDVLSAAARVAAEGRPILVEVAIDYSEKTFFTRGVVKTGLLRLPLKDQVRFVGRALLRKVTG